MKQDEIEEIISHRFKKIDTYFSNAIQNFGSESILKLRSEIRKLKVFLHLVSMESENGTKYHISKRMQMIYAYLGIIQNLDQQLKEALLYRKELSMPTPVFYVRMLEKQLTYWKKLSKGYINPAYDFFIDQKEITDNLPNGLSGKSISGFIDYTVNQIGEMSAYIHKEALYNVRDSMENIYYNLPLLKPFQPEKPSILFDVKEVKDCLGLFGNFRNKSMTVALLHTINPNGLNKDEKQFIKKMGKNRLREKNEIRGHLAAKLDFIYMQTNKLHELPHHAEFQNLPSKPLQ